MARALRAAVACLALGAAPLDANPDLGGHVDLRGGVQTRGPLERGAYMDGAMPVDAEARLLGGSGLQLAFTAPLGEAFSAVAGLGLSSEDRYEERLADGGSQGRLQTSVRRLSQAPSLGLILHPGAWLRGPYAPGLDSPDGAIHIPSFSAAWHQGHASVRHAARGTLHFDGAAAPADRDERDQGFSLGMTWPLSRGVTAFHHYRRQTWAQAYDGRGTFSVAHAWEGLGYGLRLYSTLGAPEPMDIAEHLPRQGRPGGLRLELGTGWENHLALGRRGRIYHWAEVRYAPSSVAALGLHYRRERLDLPLLDIPGLGLRAQQQDSDHVELSLHFNLASPRWRGRPVEEPVEARPAPLPKEWPEAEAPARPEAQPNPQPEAKP